ncbi:MAG: LacI family DNA-binding transcriptional regulator [Cloacibacillus sp.]
MKVTMQEVAERAGVDKATVSRVLRGDHRISEKTKIKVMESVRALDYRLDRSARSLSTHKSGLVGVVVGDLNRPWLGAFLAGLDRAFSNSSYEILLKSTQNNPLRAKNVRSSLYERHAEGIVWCDAASFPDELNVPAVTFGFKAPDCCSVTMEESSDEPTFETGVLAGRLILQLVTGRPIPGREIVVKSSKE